MKSYYNLVKVTIIAFICICFIFSMALKGEAANVSNVSVSLSPFNPNIESTTISYDLTNSAILFLNIYNSSDILVRDLIHPANKTTTNKSSGSNSDIWNGRNDSAAIVPEATYPYHIDDITFISVSTDTGGGGGGGGGGDGDRRPYDVVVDPSNSNIFWVTESDGGLLKSIDGGSTWSQVSYGGSGPAYGIAISNNGNNIYIIDDGNNTLYYSTDGGGSWNSRSLWSGVITPRDIACSPDGTILYAVDSGTQKVYKSIDSGVNWNSGTQPTGANTLTGVAVNPNDNSVILSGRYDSYQSL